MSIREIFSNIGLLILKPFITLLVVIATVLFLWGVIQLLSNQDNEEARSKGKQHIAWGIVGLFVIITVWGLVKVLCNTLGTCLPVSF
ncbi:MAG: hypothetical protein COU46_00920 [Candidatus Niyogibacteria bacterium CG10_big_fil_rev_8_21_14_0_10_42_19]|uniref:Uncharacterized protein n=1 Tax=Candidatus Niyogibacteria bacterium CG10_big_fil_rev_8_21_14_0_10_42_19 TaxID=1974725 RepID=A0A2H0TG81_9BACT|nr:MAG: hypothetical protein COU46_00920 [Candidatus Niyogibacteria bacterium CG10_big_fil_rev_8_21_14_0_10_42_19]